MLISDWSSDVCSSDHEGVVEGDQRDEIIGHRAGVLAGDPVRLRTEAGARGHIDSRDHAQPGDPGGAGMQWPQQVEIVDRSEEHTSELQSLMRISYAVFCLKKTKI